MSEHSPTPWDVAGNVDVSIDYRGESESCFSIFSAEGLRIAVAWPMLDGLDKANAAFIVLAANLHDELVGQAKLLLGIARSMKNTPITVGDWNWPGIADFTADLLLRADETK